LKFQNFLHKPLPISFSFVYLFYFSALFPVSSSFSQQLPEDPQTSSPRHHQNSSTMGHLTSALLRGISLLLVTQCVFTMMLFNATDLGILLDKYLEDDDGDWMVERQRGKRAITTSDMQAILNLHNKLRGQVYPPASNMEYMVKRLFSATNDQIW